MIEPLTERAEEIFCSALEIRSLDERNRYIERVCRGDAGLRAMVDRMLDSQPAAEKYFQEGGVARLPMNELKRTLEDTPGLVANLGAPDADEVDNAVGTRVGPYKLLQRIGEGGCGVVYMAEQERPVRRKVAFKVIKLGMDTKSVIARFEAERQALAIMDHPNIARVLDAGATESGRPYFVMELVRGVKITEYCDQNELDIQQRLRLFIHVCQAIQHAHQKGVIHRDIKPSNILVTIIDGGPVPKVIDFGIAKAIEGRLTDNTIFTAYEQFIGTPAYMSPEQAVMSGVDVDTRSDIYSLGVLLYELLTGRPPFENKELLVHGIDGLRRTLQDEEPKRPSVLVTTLHGSALTQLARNHHAEPFKLISTLQGDLDWIVVKALEKERSRRYETANGLAMDVQRYLDNEPVLARPPSRYYRLQKLVRRNKVTFISATMVALAVIVGLGLATWFWVKERGERKVAVAAEEHAIAVQQQQAKLLLEAEDRESIADAAYLISQGKIQDADDRVSKVTDFRPADILPSLESESVLRTLGETHALKEQWSQAWDRFNLLLGVDQKDNSWEITSDLLRAGPIQIERGDLQGYDRFRRAAIARYLGTTDPVFAERTLKISLLVPADADVMKSLETFSDIAANSMESAGKDPIMEAWRCVSLGLMAYRQGFYPTSETWCKRCLAYTEDNPCRIATAHIINSMACYQQGDLATARMELAAGRDLVNGKLAKPLDSGNGGVGFWYDWLFAQILQREAEALIEKPAGAKE